MNDEEQFTENLRAAADAAPAISVDPHRILQAGRRRRRLRPVLGTAVGVLGVSVAVAAFSALQPASSAIGPASTAITTPPLSTEGPYAAETRLIDDQIAATEAEIARLQLDTGTPEQRRQAYLMEIAASMGLTDPPDVPVVRYVSAAESAQVMVQCLTDAGIAAQEIPDRGYSWGASAAEKPATVLAYYTCSAQYSPDFSAGTAPAAEEAAAEQSRTAQAAAAQEQLQALRNQADALRAETQRLLDLATMAQDLGITNPPQAPVVKRIVASTYGAVYARCLTDAGFPAAETPDGGVQAEVPTSEQQAYNLAFYTCSAQYPVEGGHESVRTP